MYTTQSFFFTNRILVHSISSCCVLCHCVQVDHKTTAGHWLVKMKMPLFETYTGDQDRVIIVNIPYTDYNDKFLQACGQLLENNNSPTAIQAQGISKHPRIWLEITRDWLKPIHRITAQIHVCDVNLWPALKMSNKFWSPFWEISDNITKDSLASCQDTITTSSNLTKS